MSTPNLAQLADAIGRLTGNELHRVAVLLSQAHRVDRWLHETDEEAMAAALESLPPVLLSPDHEGLLSHEAAS